MQKKVAVITGGSRGIGRAIAQTLGEHHYQLALVARNQENLNEVKKELHEIAPGIEVFCCDVSKIDDVKKTVSAIWQHFQQIDVLVNSAGFSTLTPLEKENYENWQKHLDINLNGTYYFSREVFLKMKQNPTRQSIINLASILGLTGSSGYSAYCAAKHGIIGLTKAMALELAPFKITVNAICPGWVTETDMFETDMQELADFYGIDKDVLITEEKLAMPLQKFSTPDEIARLVAYLVSEAARNITGQAINISGGLGIA